jgi:hypothetical protein
MIIIICTHSGRSYSQCLDNMADVLDMYIHLHTAARSVFTSSCLVMALTMALIVCSSPL